MSLRDWFYYCSGSNSDHRSYYVLSTLLLLISFLFLVVLGVLKLVGVIAGGAMFYAGFGITGFVFILSIGIIALIVKATE